METLARQGDFTPPNLETVEAAARYGLGLKRGRVFVDLWNLRGIKPQCALCFPRRIDCLHEMNLSQHTSGPIECTLCGGHS